MILAGGLSKTWQCRYNVGRKVKNNVGGGENDVLETFKSHEGQQERLHSG